MKLHRAVFALYVCSLLLVFQSQSLFSDDDLFWWGGGSSNNLNFGDELSAVIVSKIIGKPVRINNLLHRKKCCLAAGSILHFARDGDVIWGSGFREDPSSEHRFSSLDVRAVRGPLTRQFLLQKGIACPETYGDPAVLMGVLFPEYRTDEKLYDYIIIPNIGEIPGFASYKNVVLPTLPWPEIIKKINQSRLVISSSLHGIIVAESYGVPARLLKMTWIESLLKYQDYYESTGRKNFTYATSVQDAIRMGGERPGNIDVQALLNAFPWDYYS